MARGDVTVLGDLLGDALVGGAGNDRFHVRDGERDLVDCGTGVDTVIADQFDIVDLSCERARIRRVLLLAPAADDPTERKTEAPAEDRKES